MQPTAVQTPVGLAGQSGIATQPSVPSTDIAPVQTQTVTAELPKADLYKEGLNSIKKSYSEKMKATLPKMTDAATAARFIHQATTERDMAIAEHNSASFQQELMGLMQDNGMNPMQKAQIAMGLNSKYKTGLKPNEIMNMFTKGSTPVVVGRGGAVVDPMTGKVIYENPYVSGRVGRPAGITTPALDDNGNPVVSPERPAKPGKLTQDQIDVQNYEKGVDSSHDKDKELIDEYNRNYAAFSTEGDTAEKIAAGTRAKLWMDANQDKVDAAMRRMNKYWKLKNQTPTTTATLAEILD
jgi:hypothetical protein